MEIVQVFVNAATLIIVAIIGWQLNSKHAMRMAVVEKRFLAHQEAYGLVVTVIVAVGYGTSERIGQAIEEVGNWWVENNLYLDAKARAAVGNLLNKVISYNKKMDVDDEMKHARLKELKSILQVISNSVDLPPLADDKFIWKYRK